MNRTLKLKILLLVALAVMAIVMLVPSFYKQAPQWWKHYLAPEGLRLGLDLQGGMHLVLRVDLEKAVEHSLDLEAQDLKDELGHQQISVVRTPTSNPRTAVFTVPNTRALGTIRQVIEQDFPDLRERVETNVGSFPRIVLQLSKKRIGYINQNAVNQSLEIIRNRIDQFGVAEPVILRQGTDKIVVELPGIKNPQRAIKLIGETAQLEFKLVAESPGVDLPGLIQQAIDNGEWHRGEGTKKLNQVLKSQLPANTEAYFERQVDPDTGAVSRTPILLKKQVMMTGEMIKDARVRVGGTFNEPYVSLDLTDRGSRVFAQITSKNVGRRFAIILDGVVRSAPVIRERILGGRAQISGGFTYQEASDLAIVLRAGALPAPVNIIQNLTVGASLGADSIHKGLMSGILGALLVLAFMLIYYRLSGVIADGALVLNILFLFACLGLLQATLTLPGIAGIILSIGMGVDSNIIILERMREEFAVGKSVKSGVEAGYSNALSAVVDSHITTLITAVALFLFGTGPIKGFAVTLSLGVMVNLFTTLFGTRLIYDAMYAKRRLKMLHFGELIKKPNLDYMRLRNVAFTFSGILVLLGVVAFVQTVRGHANLGVDFSGGTLMEYQASKPFNLGEVRPVFAGTNLADVRLQKVENENRLIVKLKKSQTTVGALAKRITSLLNQKLPDKHFVVESQSSIGSSVSKTLRNDAMIAIAISLIGVIVYIGFRFDFQFGIAATIATFHDVLAVLGICWLLNKEINLLLITALLTLAGYSLSDTVIIFDRIRETLTKTKRGASFAEVINRSVNDVMTRTLGTSLTTLLAVAALFLLGGSSIHEFSFAMLMGILVGTYSSIFVASPLLHLWRHGKVS